MVRHACIGHPSGPSEAHQSSLGFPDSTHVDAKSLCWWLRFLSFTLPFFSRHARAGNGECSGFRCDHLAPADSRSQPPCFLRLRLGPAWGDTLSTRSSSCAGRYPLYPVLLRGEIPSLPGPLRARGDTLSTRSSSCAGRCRRFPILLLCGEIPSLPDPLHVWGDTLSTRFSSCAGRYPLYPICPRVRGDTLSTRSSSHAGGVLSTRSVASLSGSLPDPMPSLSPGSFRFSSLPRLGGLTFSGIVCALICARGRRSAAGDGGARWGERTHIDRGLPAVTQLDKVRKND